MLFELFPFNIMRIQKLVILLAFVVFSCEKKRDKSANSTEKPNRIVNVPQFNADSAYFFVKKQVDFGPRIPNTEAHRKTGDYLVNTFKKYGATVVTQEFESTTYDGKRLKLKNIIASYFPQRQKRVLLAAHWDARPFASKDKVNKDKPFDAANDGASGVGVILEIARTIQASPAPEIGIDLILFDGEDWGNETDHDPESWCLGSQYWSKQKHKSNYSAYYGIVLDMVGGKNAQFYREGASLQYAPKIVENVWNTAERLGYSHLFVKRNTGELTDDHVFINQFAKIPTIDIITHDPESGFGTFHHTQDDNMNLISKETLKGVGETLLNVVYYEESGS